MEETQARSLHTGELREQGPLLRAGERVHLSGPVYTARDAAHRRILALLREGKPLPFPLAGSNPTPPGLPVGSCGPTTSGRMDPFTPALLDLGLACMIGKGKRSSQVVEAKVRNGAV